MPEPEPEPEPKPGPPHFSRESPVAIARDPDTALVVNLINKYGRASVDAMTRLDTEIARVNYLIDTKYDINMKLTAAAFSLAFLYGQNHRDDVSGST